MKKKDNYNECMPKDYSSPMSSPCKIYSKNNQSSFNVIHFFFIALLPIPIAFLYSIFLGSWIGSTLFHAVYLAPLMEEFFKISGIFLFVMLHPQKIISSAQIIWASFIAAFSFAIVENMLYAYFKLAHISGQLFSQIMTYRWFFLTLIHVLCTIIASLGMIYIWKCKQAGKKVSLAMPILFFLIAVVIHASYNAAVLLL